jgi:hypothetical protein
MSAPGTLDGIVDFAVGAFSWLRAAFADRENCAEFLRRFGWDVDPETFELDDFKSAFGGLQPLLDSINGATARAQDLSNATGDDKWPIVAEMGGRVAALVQALGAFSPGAGAALPSPLNTAAFEAFLNDFPALLLDFLLATELEYNHDKWAAALQLIGVFERREIVFDPPEPGRVDYISKRFAWKRLADLISDPKNVLNDVYDWNEPGETFDAPAFLENLDRLLLAFGLATSRHPPEEIIRDKYGYAATQLSSLPKWLRIPLFEGQRDGAWVNLGFFLQPIPALPGNSRSAGLLWGLFVDGGVTAEMPLAGDFALLLRGGFESGRDFGVEIRPASVTVTAPEDLAPTVWAEAAIEGRWPSRLLLFGTPDGTRLTIDALRVRARIEADGVADAEAAIEVGLGGGEIVVAASDGDSFLKALLPEGGLRSTFDADIGWSSVRGIYLKGSAGLEATIPIHFALGPLEVVSLYVKLSANEDALQAKVGASFSARLGPVTASLERVGVTADMRLPAGGESGRGFDVVCHFLPPTGAGLAIDAGGVTGGGYIAVDAPNGRYSGTLQLAFGEIGLGAVGLVATKLPDGSDGFSLLVSVSVAFSPPIQLSLGFTLSAVGGLVAINREMNVDALRNGMKARTLDSVLMPTDLVANASKIISDLESVFPVREGRAVVGPVVTIGYGTPNIITADIGIFLELPEPLNVLLLGQVHAALPTETNPLLVINLDVVGNYSPALKRITIDAALVDSRLLTYTLSGGSATWIEWGSHPLFLCSVGGMHPAFKEIPDGFIVPDRLSIALSNKSDFQLTARSYFAITSNTLQFGASLSLDAKTAGVDIDGSMGLDVLISSPFSFVADFTAHVSVKYRGRSLASVRLDAELSGPRPWHADGRASFSILRWDVDVHLSETWGSDTAVPSLAAVNPWDRLVPALQLREAWGSVLSTRRPVAETLRPIDTPTADDLYCHPDATLEIKQRVLPFNLNLERLGNAPIAGLDRFWASSLKVGAQSLGQPSYGTDYFARGQYENLSNSDRLSKPSFEQLDGIIRLASNLVRTHGPAAGSAAAKAQAPRLLEYETTLYAADRSKEDGGMGSVAWAVGKRIVRSNAVRRSPFRMQGSRKFEVLGARPKVKVSEEKFQVVNKETHAVSATATSRIAADQARAASGTSATSIVVPQEAS